MDELLELIERIGSDNPPTEQELSEARGELVDLLKVATAAETRDLESATALREAIDAIDAETTARAEQAEREEAEARRLLEGLTEPDDTDDTDGDAEGDTGSGDADADADADTREPEPVAAANGARRNLSSALRRTSARMTTDNPGGPSHTRAITLGPAQGEHLGPNPDLRSVARVFERAATRVKGRGARDVLVRVEHDYPEPRRLFGSERFDNDQLLDAIASPQAIAAAGGVCDPLPADFTHPILGVRGRPIRDALPRFQANRGGVRFSPTGTLADLTGAVGVWTHDTDTSPGESEKVCLTLECEEEALAYVDAVTACLTIGNFQARFNPEFWRSRLQLLMVLHDRIAEQALYADILAGSTAVTYGAGNGTIYSVLSAMDKAVAGMRSRHRLGKTVIRAIAPEWVHQALRADIASQKLGSSPAEALTVADNIIDAFFTSRGIRPVWTQDVEVFGAQNAGALLGFPGGDVQVALFPEGTFFFMDGGMLDLGTEIVDSELIRQNNRMAFMETFEKAVKRGGESLRITVPVAEQCVCPEVLETSPA